MQIVMPDVHRTAHNRHQVKPVERGNGLALVESDGNPAMPRFTPKIAEDAGMFNPQMLKHENTHECFPSGGGAKRRGDRQDPRCREYAGPVPLKFRWMNKAKLVTTGVRDG